MMNARASCLACPRPLRRLEVAEDHMRKCLLNAPRVPGRYGSAGRDGAAEPGVPSLRRARRSARRRNLQVVAGDRRVQWTAYGPGDGTVLASSVRLDEPDRGSSNSVEQHHDAQQQPYGAAQRPRTTVPRA